MRCSTIPVRPLLLLTPSIVQWNERSASFLWNLGAHRLAHIINVQQHGGVSRCLAHIRHLAHSSCGSLLLRSHPVIVSMRAPSFRSPPSSSYATDMSLHHVSPPHLSLSYSFPLALTTCSAGMSVHCSSAQYPSTPCPPCCDPSRGTTCISSHIPNMECMRYQAGLPTAFPAVLIWCTPRQKVHQTRSGRAPSLMYRHGALHPPSATQER